MNCVDDSSRIVFRSSWPGGQQPQLSNQTSTTEMSGDEDTGNIPDDAPPLAAAVTPKLRAFNPEEPELWFANADFQFDTAHPPIKKSMTKFKYACMALSPEVQRQVKGLFLQPPENPYEALKARLCKVYHPSKAEIATRILDAPALGDSTASDMVARMLQHLPEGQQDHILVRECFLRRLPLDIRRVVETNPTNDVWDLAERADELLKGRVLPDITGTPEIAAATGTRPKTKTAPDRKPPRPGNSSKKGPRTWCWKHRKFGAEARNCTGRCEWPNYPVAVNEIQEN